jgi:hypothetical protein
MDRTQDVILGVLTGQQYLFKYPGIEAYVESIRRSGFTGRKVMLSWNLNPTTRETLVKYGFEVIDLLPWPPERFFHARMRVAWEYLRDHHKEFRYVLWLDIKDLVLQTDPSIWLENHIKNYKLIGSTECVTIEQEETNQLWAKSILGEDKYQEIKNEEVINGGTWAGDSEAMTEVFHQVHLGCQTYSGGFPPCQIWINYVMRQSPFKQVLHIPRWAEGFAACLHPCWSPWRTPCWPYMRDPHPVLHLDSCVLYPGLALNPDHRMLAFNNRDNFERAWIHNKGMQIIKASSGCLQGIELIDVPNNKPFSIVHGYDRDYNTREMFEFKYRFHRDFDWEAFKREKADLMANVRPEFRRLRDPKIYEEIRSAAAAGRPLRRKI